MSAWRTTLLSFTIGYDVVKQEGLGALMKGANVFATKRVFDWASRYYFADLFEDLFTHLRDGSSLSVAEKSAASLLGGVFSTMVTLPLDVLVAKTQDAKKAGIAVSPIKLFQEELREKGWNGIRNAYMRGFEARLLHVCLTTVGTFVSSVCHPYMMLKFLAGRFNLTLLFVFYSFFHQLLKQEPPLRMKLSLDRNKIFIKV